MTTAEAMAVAVLKGDLTAARALADLLVETVGRPAVLPVRVVDSPSARVKAVVFVRPGTRGDVIYNTVDLVAGWLSSPTSSVVAAECIERIELYELPKGNG